MIKRIGALAFIFVCTSIAWIILGSTIFSRTESPLSSELKSRVAGNWGTEQQQSPPKATYQHEFTRTEEDGKETKQIKASETISLSFLKKKKSRSAADVFVCVMWTSGFV